MVGIISVVIGDHFGGGDHFDGGDHFGGGTDTQHKIKVFGLLLWFFSSGSYRRSNYDILWYRHGVLLENSPLVTFHIHETTSEFRPFPIVLVNFWATFCGSSNLEQILPFWATFEQNIGFEHISSAKKSTISQKTSIYVNFLNVYQFFISFQLFFLTDVSNYCEIF